MQGVTLGTIAGGALNELFEAELAKVLNNITDPNTDTKTRRAITLTIRFKPGRDRDVADVEVACASRLAGIMTVNSQVFMGRHKGRLIAVENDPRQQQLFDQADRPLAAVASFPPKESEQ